MPPLTRSSATTPARRSGPARSLGRSSPHWRRARVDNCWYDAPLPQPKRLSTASRARAYGGAIRHGDPSLDNIHVTHDGKLHFYDLDLAGPGWQVEDLTGGLSTTFAGPFLDGYVTTRPLPAVDIEALPWLRMLSAIDNLKFRLIDKPAAMGVSTLSEGWVDRGFDALASAAHDAGLDAVERPQSAQ